MFMGRIQATTELLNYTKQGYVIPRSQIERANQIKKEYEDVRKGMKLCEIRPFMMST